MAYNYIYRMLIMVDTRIKYQIKWELKRMIQVRLCAFTLTFNRRA